MFFNKLTIAKTFSLGLMSLLMVSCIKINEGPITRANPETSQNGCLANGRSIIRRYFEGKSSRTEIEQLGDCAETSIRDFADLTRGAQKDKYTPYELRNFLHRYFVGKKTRFSDSFVEEFMLLKQAIIGGNTTDFDLNDLNQLITIIRSVKDQLLKMLPYMPLDGEEFIAYPAAHVDQVAEHLVEAAKAIGARVEHTQVPYSFVRLERFLNELEGAFPDASAPNLIRNKITLIQILKSIVVSADPNAIAPHDWPQIFIQSAKTFSIAIKLRHLRGHYSSVYAGEGRARLVAIAHETERLLLDVIHQNGGVVTFEQIEPLVDHIALGDLQVKRKTIKEFIRPLFQRVLGGTESKSSQGRAAKGLTEGLVKRVMTAVEEWSEGQRYLEGVYALQSRTHTSYPYDRLYPDEFNRVSYEDALSQTGEVTKLGKSMAADLSKMMNEPRSVFAEKGEEIRFPSPEHRVTGNFIRRRSFDSISQANWIRRALSLAMRGYTGNPAIGSSLGITLEEFQLFSSDVWGLILDFNWANPRKDPIVEGNKRFREANLFSPAANGDSYMSLDESTHLIQFLISSKELSVRLHESVVRICRLLQPSNIGPNDYFGKPTVHPDCYRSVVFSDSPRGSHSNDDLWKYMPAFAHHFRNLSSAERTEFIQKVEEAVRLPGVKPTDFFDSGDSETLGVITHYMEALFTRYDEDFSGGLDYPESRRAFPQFKKILTEVSGFDRGRPSSKVDDKVEALFTYLLNYGKPPVTDDMNFWDKIAGGYSFISWRIEGKRPKGKKYWVFNSTRTKVFEVFGQIGKLADSTPVQTDNAKLIEKLEESWQGAAID